MRKSIVFLFFTLTTTFSLQAQNTEAAKKLLDEVSAKIASFKTMTFDFDYVLENRQENIKQETNGSVTVSGDRYKLLFLGAEQLYDGEKTYTIVPENEEITIDEEDYDDEDDEKVHWNFILMKLLDEVIGEEDEWVHIIKSIDSK